jgi:hypothetical protein
MEEKNRIRSHVALSPKGCAIRPCRATGFEKTTAIYGVTREVGYSGGQRQSDKLKR